MPLRLLISKPPNKESSPENTFRFILELAPGSFSSTRPKTCRQINSRPDPTTASLPQSRLSRFGCSLRSFIKGSNNFRKVAAPTRINPFLFLRWCRRRRHGGLLPCLQPRPAQRPSSRSLSSGARCALPKRSPGRLPIRRTTNSQRNPAFITRYYQRRKTASLLQLEA